MSTASSRYAIWGIPILRRRGRYGGRGAILRWVIFRTSIIARWRREWTRVRIVESRAPQGSGSQPSQSYKFYLSAKDHHWKLCCGKLPKLVYLCVYILIKSSPCSWTTMQVDVREPQIENRCLRKNIDYNYYLFCLCSISLPLQMFACFQASCLQKWHSSGRFSSCSWNLWHSVAFSSSICTSRSNVTKSKATGILKLENTQTASKKM